MYFLTGTYDDLPGGGGIQMLLEELSADLCFSFGVIWSYFIIREKYTSML